jgi:PAS domain S-box-containing protein
MLDNIYHKLKRIKLWNLLWISLVLSEVFTAVMNAAMGLLWWGRIDLGLLLIGAVDAFVVALVVTVIMILIFKAIRDQEKEAKEAFADINTKLQALINAIPDMVVFKDVVGRHVVVNRAVEEVTGHGRDEITGKIIEELLPPDPAAACRKSDEQAMRQSVPTRAEERIVRRDGSVSYFDMVKAPMVDDGGAVIGLVAVGRDITERKQIEVSMKQSEEKFRTLFESASDALFIVNLEGLILDVNAIAYERLGYTREELLSLHLSQLDPPSFAAMIPERMKRLRQFGRVAFESAHVRKDGSVMPVEINAKTMGLNGKPVIFSVIRDITERKQAEQALQEKTRQLEDLTRNLEKKVEEEIAIRMKNERMMMQQSKLAAMGEMLGAISHQWRQPLNVVGLIVQRIEDAHARGKLDSAYLAETVEKAMSQILHMSKAIEDFRGFYKPDKEKTLFDAMRAVGDVLSLVSAQLAADNIIYRLTCHTHERTFENEADIVFCSENAVEGFKNEFEHAILNLVNNARDAIIEKKARGGIAASERGLLSFDFYDANDRVIIKVSDNGGGIPPEAMGSIFDPYFTTKETSKGTGLGLYLSKVIVEDHMQGKLSADNTEGGVIFTIELPHPEREAHHESKNAV